MTDSIDCNAIREEIVVCSRRAYERKLVFGVNGNFSVFSRKNGLMFITPSAASYENMLKEDIVAMDLNNNSHEAGKTPSSEWRMHAVIYKSHPHINAIAHTHSPYASAFAALRQTIPAILLETLELAKDAIPCAEFAPPGSWALGDIVALNLTPNINACLMSNHGALSVGDSLLTAYNRAEYLENAARVYHISLQMGRPYTLNADDITELK